MWNRVAPALLLCAVLFRSSRPQEPPGCGREATASACRLPTATRPVWYDLQFGPQHVDGAGSTFSGVTRIAVYARLATDVITLNAKDLDVTDVRVTDVRLAADIAVVRLAYRVADEQLEIRLSACVAVGRTYLVTVSYGGNIRTDDTGLYAGSYNQGDVTK